MIFKFSTMFIVEIVKWLSEDSEDNKKYSKDSEDNQKSTVLWTQKFEICCSSERVNIQFHDSIFYNFRYQSLNLHHVPEHSIQIYEFRWTQFHGYLFSFIFLCFFVFIYVFIFFIINIVSWIWKLQIALNWSIMYYSPNFWWKNCIFSSFLSSFKKGH